MAKQILECHRCHRRRSADRMSARIVDAQLVIRCLARASCASLAKAAKRAARDGGVDVTVPATDPVSFASGQQTARREVAARARAMAEAPIYGLDRTTWRAALLAIAAEAENPDPEPLTRNGEWVAAAGG